MMKRDEGIQVIRAIVADCLGLAIEDVSSDSRLVADLGAASLDFVDLIFTIEKRFGIKVREGELDLFSRMSANSPRVTKEGFLTRESIAEFSPWLPALRNENNVDRITPAQLYGLITVETLWLVVEKKQP